MNWKQQKTTKDIEKAWTAKRRSTAEKYVKLIEYSHCFKNFVPSIQQIQLSVK